jgi:hypothetical protein
MKPWRGWTADTAAIQAPTWTEWSAAQHRTLPVVEQHDERCPPEDVRFSTQEWARLCFLRWLNQSGRLSWRVDLPHQGTTTSKRETV